MAGNYSEYIKRYDYCYLVNPFFPTQSLTENMKEHFDILMREYPSGMEVNCELAAAMLGIRKEYVCVGNGTSELIKSLMEHFTEKIGVVYPTFEEYPNRKGKIKLVPMYTKDMDYEYSVDALMEYYSDKECDAILLVNPDNPSGHFIEQEDLLRLSKWCLSKSKMLVVDESFVDFADVPNQTLLDNDILSNNPNLIVLKSISKSYGVPGLRLGVIATANEELIRNMKKDVAIWNINSFAEYYMQIIGEYRDDYEVALARIREVRKEFVQDLNGVSGLKVYPTQANYVMCKITAKISSRNLAEIMLSKYNILIKDLSAKDGFGIGEYIRLSVKTKEENEVVIRALEEVLKVL